MKTFAVSLELIARTALFMTVITLSIKQVLKDRKTVKAASGKRRP